MPDQLTLASQADGGFEAHRKATLRDVFLTDMGVVPWSQLGAMIEPIYPKARPEGGRRPVVWRGRRAFTSCSIGMR